MAITARDQFNKIIAGSGEIQHDDFRLTSEEEYAEALKSIQDHKYFTNEKIPYEITMDEALFSWYENVYYPLLTAIDDEALALAFPKATQAELVLWVATHWHFMKEKAGRDLSPVDAVISYGAKFSDGWFAHLYFGLKFWLLRK